jgi:hypothetical protein
MHHALSSRSHRDTFRRSRPKLSCRRHDRMPASPSIGTRPGTTRPTSRTQKRNRRLGLGGKGKALAICALAATFALLTYGSYAESATSPRTGLQALSAVHAGTR